jgi:hypothetical protein
MMEYRKNGILGSSLRPEEPTALRKQQFDGSNRKGGSQTAVIAFFPLFIPIIPIFHYSIIPCGLTSR